MPNPITLNEKAYDDEGVAYDKIVYVNKSFLRNIGYTSEDIPDDRIWFTKAYPDSAYQKFVTTEWDQAVDKAQKEQADLIGFPAKVCCKDGSFRWFNVTTQLEHTIDNKYRTIVFVETQAPEQIKVELDKKSQELMQEQNIFKTIIDSIPTRIFWKDTEGIYLGCNRAFLSDARLEKEEQIIGKTDYEMVWKEDAQRFIDDDRSVWETGISKLNYIEAQPQEGGKDLTLSTSKVPLVDLSGKTIGVIGIYQDITEEVEAKKSLQEQEQLFIVQSRQAAMGEMISMIAHQWRQPLTAISAMVGNLQVRDAIGTLTTDDIQKQSNAISNQITYLSQTISDFSEFFKPNKTKTTILAHDPIISALAIIDKLLLYNEIELHTQFDAKHPLSIYAKELQQVCINILKNASDALSDSEATHKQIKISTKDNEQSVTLSFQDNAGGIPADIITKIFEPYFSTKREKNGTGLGLYITKTIIENHLKGSISCINDDEGAIFSIELPLS